MKKLLLSLGALSAVVAPVAAVVACGSTTTSTLSENGKKSLDAYKTQANALSDGDVKTAALAAIDKIKSDQDLAKFVQSQAGKDLISAAMAGAATQPEAPKTDDEVKAELGTMVKDILADTKYTMDDAEQGKLVEELFKLDGSKDLKVVDTLAGKLSDKTHGTDDFMVLIGGAEQEEVTAESGFEYMTKTAASEIAAPKTRLTLQGVTVAANIDESAQDVKSRWGQTEKDVKDANFVLYLQNNEDTSKVTVQLSKIFKFDGKTWEYEDEEKTLQGHVTAAKDKGDAVTFDVKDNSLIDFTATHTAPTNA